ncbi:MAG: GNAT family N-acetyltransferase, partial [Saprospiraceae bacterium]
MLEINFDPFPLLESKKMNFRAISESDVEEMFRLRSDADIMRYIPRPLIKSREESLEHIRTILNVMDKKEGINWGMHLKNQT